MNEASSLSLNEIEELGYYDFMAYLQVPFFNIGGYPSLDLLAERCNIGPDSHVLDVGCGTGGNSSYLAKKYGCMVTGIDISELMIEKAKTRIIEESLEDKLQFQVGDACNLDFSNEEFDIVITVFVSQFLDLGQAFPEFHRVLKNEGYLGVNEMFRDSNIPMDLVDKVDYGEEVFRELTDLPFRLRSPSMWESGFAEAGFGDVWVESFTNRMGVSEVLEMVDSMGGWLTLLSYLGKVVWLGLRSSKLRKKFGDISRGKRVLVNDRDVRSYVGYVLGVGQK